MATSKNAARPAVQAAAVAAIQRAERSTTRRSRSHWAVPIVDNSVNPVRVSSHAGHRALDVLEGSRPSRYDVAAAAAVAAIQRRLESAGSVGCSTAAWP